MRIGIDPGVSISARKTGIGVYTAKLFRALNSLDPGNEYVLLNRGTASMRGPLSLVQRFLYLMDLSVGAPVRYRASQLDLVHFTNAIVPPIRTTVYVTTIHDLHSVVQNNLWAGYQLYRRILLSLSCRRADRVIAVSNHTKKDIVKLFGVSESRIDVIYHGVGEDFKRLDSDVCREYMAKRFGVADDYLLCLGQFKPRKNVRGLIRAFHRLKRRPGGIHHKLVLAGEEGWMENDVVRLIRELGLSEDTMILGYVPQSDLPLLYNAASLFVYPSFYEGFGLPILEAMACGVPVVCSNATSLPEVAGDAAIQVDPHDLSALAGAIRAVLTRPCLREELVQKGLVRARAFSWQDTARKTLQVYQTAFQSRVNSTSQVS